ncbi:hypothetical protein PBI_DRMANHATTAN_62 [Arthrobacter phage DrManhattan]|uniref:Uncharacterized protein n=2 Tax=Manhattanvirus drmanhattan TaxID=2734250 RepID=A0A3G2KFP6_9CAUD|nr:hypothetical protein HOU48_gp62 [Arthrobacter phage DrManhattan]AYN57780.1 hypothetical protein PBI_DRMANHATTAN_62 [Arthrobacter phage DrManhattan]QHB36643.1 hypothetical protein SEA_ADOLIN_61 [Arthrobacter phage Adolin]
MTHRTATLTADALSDEIQMVYTLGSDGPGFCNKPYVGLASCERIGDHDGEHVVTGRTGRLIAFN